jgi:hypothetical protein
MVSQVPIGQPIHETVPQRVEFLLRSRLRDAGASPVARQAIGSHREIDRAAERGVRGRDEIDRESPKVQRIGSDADEIGRRRRGWWSGAIEIGRKNGIVRWVQVEALLRGGKTLDHFGAIHGAHFGAQKRFRVPCERVVGSVVGVGPDSQLGIVVGVGELERIARVGAQSIRAGGDRNTFVIRRPASDG